MNKDLKNVLITFGLIALVFTQGSFVYRIKVKNEYISALEQEKLQRIKIIEFTKAKQNITVQVKQQVLPKKQVAKKILTAQKTKSNNTANQNTSLATQAQADLTRQQAIILSQQTAQAQAQQQADAIAQQQAQVIAQQQTQQTQSPVSSPSRQSKAS